MIMKLTSSEINKYKYQIVNTKCPKFSSVHLLLHSYSVLFLNQDSNLIVGGCLIDKGYFPCRSSERKDHVQSSSLEAKTF